MGAHVAILRRTPHHEDLITSTDSEVLCRLVDRWVGQGGKASLANTADADILEFLLANLEHWIGREKITDGNNVQRVWCFHTMTGTWVNGKKAHGTGLFGMQ